MTKKEAHTLLEIMATNITGELIGSGHLTTEQTKLLTKQLDAIDMAIEALQFVEHFDLLKEFQSLQEVVRCNDYRYQVHCYQTVSHNKVHDGFKEYWSEPIEFCSRGERREE